MKTRKTIALATAAIMTIALAGCDQAPSNESGTLQSYIVKLGNGRTVQCVAGDGVSCDWDHEQ